MHDVLKSLGIERPVLQAGMGSGLASSALATAVSDAGGLGTIGILPPGALRTEIASVRALTSKPLAVNLIVPFARRTHWEVAGEADVVVTHWEASPRRRTPRTWIHTVGNADEAVAAVNAGADASSPKVSKLVDTLAAARRPTRPWGRCSVRSARTSR